ncbi:MAG: HAD family hydrolase [Ignavibacteria bacterium]|nr:HAD family hydrolase [Ignavibacteria bacterium]
MKIKAVIFDVDGTLYHPSLLKYLIISEIIKNLLLSPLNTIKALKLLRSYRKFHEEIRFSEEDNLFENQILKTAEKHKLRYEDVKIIIDEWFHTKPLKHFNISKRKNLINTFQWLKDNNIIIGLLSDYPCDHKAKALNITEFLTIIKSSMDDDINKLKPHPKGFLRMAELLNLNTDEIIYVGDRYKIDIIGAEKAGMIPVLISGNRNKYGNELIVIKSIDEIKNVITKLNS